MIKSIFWAVVFIAAFVLLGYSLFGDIPATEALPPAPDLSWIAWAVIIFVVVAVVASIVGILFHNGQASSEPDENMNYLTGLDQEIESILWELKGTPRNGARSQGSRPSSDRAAYLNGRLIKLEEQKRAFWRTHEYEKPNGGHIVYRKR